MIRISDDQFAEFTAGRRYRSRRYKPLTLPYHQYDNQAQSTPVDMQVIAQLYGSVPDGIDGLLPDDVDTVEIGVWLGGSSYLAACRARRLSGCRHITHWLIDHFGREGLVFEHEPNMEIAFAHYRAEGLHNYCAWLPGNVLTLGDKIADKSMGCCFSGACHQAEWAEHDVAFAARVVMPGGYVAVHAMHGDGRYGAYDDVIWRIAAEQRWELVIPAPEKSSLNVWRVPEV